MYYCIAFYILSGISEGVLQCLQEAYLVSVSKLHLLGTLEKSFFNFLNSFFNT